MAERVDPLREPRSPERLHRWLPRIVLPAWYLLAALLVREAQFRRLEEFGSGPGVTILALALLIAGETAVTSWFEGGRGRRAFTLAGWAFRVGLWAFALGALIEFPARLDPAGTDIFLRGIAARAWPFIPAILGAHPWLTGLAAAAWAAALELLVFRHRVLRGTVVMVLGPALAAGVLYGSYHRVLAGAPPSPAELVAQDGVQLAFDAATVTDPALADLWNYPRGLRVDGESGQAWASFGRTLGNFGAPPANLWSIDLRTGSVRTLATEQVRVLADDGDSLFAVPWHRHELLRIDKRRFEVVATLDLRDAIPSAIFEPVGMAQAGRFLFVAFTGEPWILKWDTREGRLAGRLDPRAAGILQTGDECCMLAWSPLENALFVSSRSIREGLVTRVDPDTMTVVGTATLPSLPFYAAAATVPPSQVFVLAEYARALYRVDPHTLAAEEIAATPSFSRIAFDPYLDRLLIGDYMGGRVLVMTRDGTVERTLEVGEKPAAFDITKEAVWVLSTAGIVRLDHDRLRLTP